MILNEDGCGGAPPLLAAVETILVAPSSFSFSPSGNDARQDGFWFWPESNDSSKVIQEERLVIRLELSQETTGETCESGTPDVKEEDNHPNDCAAVTTTHDSSAMTLSGGLICYYDSDRSFYENSISRRNFSRNADGTTATARPQVTSDVAKAWVEMGSRAPFQLPPSSLTVPMTPIRRPTVEEESVSTMAPPNIRRRTKSTTTSTTRDSSCNPHSSPDSTETAVHKASVWSLLPEKEKAIMSSNSQSERARIGRTSAKPMGYPATRHRSPVSRAAAMALTGETTMDLLKQQSGGGIGHCFFQPLLCWRGGKTRGNTVRHDWGNRDRPRETTNDSGMGFWFSQQPQQRGYLQEQQRSILLPFASFSDSSSSSSSSGRAAARAKAGQTQRERRIEQETQATMSSTSRKWKTAADPKSGRTYYYHVETRETQWRKPTELATPEEREEAERKEKQQRDFFAASEFILCTH